MSNEKRWFINNEKEIRYVHTFLEKNIEYDNDTSHLVVSMHNNSNSPCRSNTKIEEQVVEKFFHTRKEAQIEILIEERFCQKNTNCLG